MACVLITQRIMITHPKRNLIHEIQRLSMNECLKTILESEFDPLIFLPFTTEDSDHEIERGFFSKLESIWNEPSSCEFELLSPRARVVLSVTFEMCRRYHRQALSFRPLIESPRATLPELARNSLKKVPPALRMELKEWLGFVPIYRDNQIGSLVVVARGNSTGLMFHPKDLFSRLLNLHAGGFFLFHNHPSNDLRASKEDLILTRKVRKLGHELGNPLLGHWIIGATNQNWIDSRGTPMGERFLNGNTGRSMPRLLENS